MDKLSRTSSACKNLSESHHARLLKTESSVERNFTNLAELNQKMETSILAHRSTENSLRQEIQNLSSKIKAAFGPDPPRTCTCAESLKKIMTEGHKNSYRDGSTQQDPQVSVLLAMNNTLWLENQELKKDLKNYQELGVAKQRDPFATKLSSPSLNETQTEPVDDFLQKNMVGFQVSEGSTKVTNVREQTSVDENKKNSGDPKSSRNKNSDNVNTGNKPAREAKVQDAPASQNNVMGNRANVNSDKKSTRNKQTHSVKEQRFTMTQGMINRDKNVSKGKVPTSVSNAPSATPYATASDTVADKEEAASEDPNRKARNVLLQTPKPSVEANSGKNKQNEAKGRTKILKRKSVESETPNKPTPTDNVNARKYTTRKCFIIHDPFLKNFDPKQFSKWFDTTNLHVRSIKDIIHAGSLVSKIKASNPEAVYIHAGFGDLTDNTEGDNLLDQYKQLLYKLLESTKTKICVSMMIPVTGYPQLNSRLRQINTEVSKFITQLRSQHRYENRIFTVNNNSIGGYIDRKVGKNGASVTLCERGQKLLYLRVKDGLQRSLGIIPSHRRRRSDSTTHPRKDENHD
jgi:hypothetical protein